MQVETVPTRRVNLARGGMAHAPLLAEAAGGGGALVRKIAAQHESSPASPSTPLYPWGSMPSSKPSL